MRGKRENALWKLIPAIAAIACVLLIAGPWQTAGATNSVGHGAVATAGDAGALCMKKGGFATKKKNCIQRLKNGRLYYFDDYGDRETSAGDYMVNSKVTYKVGTKGYVTAKIVNYGKSVKYYEYSYKKSKWILKKNVWRSVYNTDCYFGNSGVLKKEYFTDTGELLTYKRGDYFGVPRQTHRLKTGKTYYFSSSSKRTTKIGWYVATGKRQVKVGSKGYVILEYNTKSGKLYEYKKGKLSAVRRQMHSLKDGRTYYFNSNSKKATKAGWYKSGDGWKAGVGSDGYVILKYNTKNGNTYVYDCTAKKWRLPGNSHIVKSILKKNPCYTGGTKITVKGLMLHSTGDGQSRASAYITSWNNEYYNRACVHAFIDAANGKTYQTLPWNYRGWHCARSGNDTHIGVEMCEPDGITYTDGRSFTVKDLNAARIQATRTYNSAVALFAKLCKKYKLNPLGDGVIVSHHEGYVRGIASDHGDPEHLWEGLGLPYTMDSFRQAVAAKMKTIK